MSLFIHSIPYREVFLNVPWLGSTILSAVGRSSQKKKEHLPISRASRCALSTIRSTRDSPCGILSECSNSHTSGGATQLHCNHQCLTHPAMCIEVVFGTCTVSRGKVNRLNNPKTIVLVEITTNCKATGISLVLSLTANW